MKQKNLVLIAVAVVCGLLAAVFTSQMSAGTKKVEETIPVLVAVKDLPVGTRLKKEDLDTYVEVKEYPKETAPAQFVSLKEELADKRTTRTMRKGDSFNPADVTKFASLSPPLGFNMMSVECTLERGVAGFAGPGSRVDVLAAIPVNNKRISSGTVSFVVPLLVDSLILAIDSQAQISAEAQVAPTLSMISLAVTPKQSLLLHAAKHRGSDIRLVLRNPEKPNIYDRVFTDDELWSILASNPDIKENPDPDELPNQGDEKVQKVKLPVAKADVPSGTELTDAAIDALFEMKEFIKPLPPQAVENLREYKGRFLTSKLSAGQFVPKSFIGDRELKLPPAPADQAAPREKPAGESDEKAEKAETPPVFHDFTVQTPSGTKKYRYQKLPNGEFKFLGELPHDGKADKTDDEEPAPKPKAKPKAKPAPEKKNEPAPEKSGEPIAAR